MSEQPTQRETLDEAAQRIMREQGCHDPFAHRVQCPVCRSNVGILRGPEEARLPVWGPWRVAPHEWARGAARCVGSGRMVHPFTEVPGHARARLWVDAP